MRYVIAAAAALAVMAGLSAWQQEKGVQKERVRVEAQGKKADAKAKVVRKAVEARKPDEVRADLRRYCRDCDP